MLKILICLVISYAISIFRYLIKVATVTDKKRNELINYAIKNNHVFHGRLIKSKMINQLVTFHDDDKRRDIYDKGIYEYEYNGKKYKAVIIEQVGNLRNEIDLFYVNNPRKATSEFNLGKNENNSFKFFIIIFIISALFSFIIYK